MTNQEWIDKALIELFVLRAGESAGTTDSNDSLDVLNQMMHALGQSDMDFNWFTQDTLGDTAPIPVWAEEGLISMLAIKLSVPFSAPVTTFLNQKAIDGRNLITRTFINLNLEGADMSHLPQGSRRGNENILTGS